MPFSPTALNKDNVGRKGRDLEATVSEQALDFDISTALSAPIAAHIADPVDAHSATAISTDDADGRFATDHVEGNLDEIGDTIQETRWNGVVLGGSYTVTGVGPEITLGATRVLVNGNVLDMTGESVVLPSDGTRVVGIDNAGTLFAIGVPPALTTENIYLHEIVTSAGSITVSTDMRLFVNDTDRKMPLTVQAGISPLTPNAGEAHFLTFEAAFKWLERFQGSGNERTRLIVRGDNTIASTLLIPINDLTIEGDGRGTRLDTGAVLSPMFDLNGKNGTQFKSLTFRAQHTGCTAIDDTGGAGLAPVVDDCLFLASAGDWLRCVDLGDTTAAHTDARISNSTFFATEVCVRVARPNSTRIMDCRAVETGAAGAYGIQIGDSAVALVGSEGRAVVRGCQTIGFISGVGIYLKGSNTKATENHVQNAGTGIHVDGGGIYAIAHNTIRNNVTGVDLDGSSVMFSGNHIDLSGTTGLTGVIVRGDGSTLTDNTIVNLRGASSYGGIDVPRGIVVTDGADNIHLTNNSIADFFNTDTVHWGVGIAIETGTSGVTITGGSIDTTKIGIQFDSGADTLQVSNTRITDVEEGVVLDGTTTTLRGLYVRLDSTATTTINWQGIAVSGDQALVDGCRLVGLRSTWNFETPFGVYCAANIVTVSNCEIVGFGNTTDSLGAGMYLDVGAGEVTISGNTFDGCWDGVATEATTDKDDLIITGNHFESINENGIEIIRGDRVRVTDNNMDGPGSDRAIKLTYVSTFDISNNTINGQLGDTDDGIFVEGSVDQARRFTVSNNVIEGMAGNGIHLTGRVSNGTINGNQIDNYIGGSVEPTATGIKLSTTLGTQSAGTVTVVSVPLTVADTVTIGGYVLTGISGTRTSGADDFDVSISNTTLMAQEIADAINDGDNSFGQVTASAALNVITLTAVQPGVIGDSITLSETSLGLTVSGANLTGGAASVEYPAYFTVADNIVQRCRDHILVTGYISDKPRNFSITGNTLHHAGHGAGGDTFDGAGGKGIGLEYCEEAVVSGNQIGRIGIHLNNTGGIFLPAPDGSGDASSTGIYGWNCDHVTITDNNIQDLTGQGDGSANGIMMVQRNNIDGTYITSGHTISDNQIQYGPLVTLPTVAEHIVVVCARGSGGPGSTNQIEHVNITGNICRRANFSSIAVSCGDNAHIVNVNVSGNNIENVDEADAAGIAVGTTQEDAVVTDVSISGNNITDTEDGYGIAVWAAEGTVRRVNISDNVIEDMSEVSSGGHGVFVRGGSSATSGDVYLTDVKVDGNTINITDSNGIYIDAFDDAPQNGEWGRFVVSNNQLSAITDNAIALTSEDTSYENVLIHGNQVTDTTLQGIIIQTVTSSGVPGISNLTISDNQVDCGGNAITISSDGWTEEIMVMDNKAISTTFRPLSFEIDYGPTFVGGIDQIQQNFKIKDNHFSGGTGSRFAMDGAPKIRNFTITGNTFEDTGGELLEIVLDNVTQSPIGVDNPCLENVQISNNIFRDCDNEALLIDVDDTNDDKGVRSVVVTNNTFHSCANNDTEDYVVRMSIVRPCFGFDISNNIFRDCGNSNANSDKGTVHLNIGDGTTGVQNVRVSRNQFSNCDSTAVYCTWGDNTSATSYNWKNMAFDHNTISNQEQYGLWLDFNEGSSMSSGHVVKNLSTSYNVISGPGEKGIQIISPDGNTGWEFYNIRVNENVIENPDNDAIYVELRGAGKSLSFLGNQISWPSGGHANQNGLVVQCDVAAIVPLGGLHICNNIVQDGATTSSGTDAKIKVVAERRILHLLFTNNTCTGGGIGVYFDIDTGTQKGVIFQNNVCRLQQTLTTLRVPTGGTALTNMDGGICSNNIGTDTGNTGWGDTTNGFADGFDVAANNLDGI